MDERAQRIERIDLPGGGSFLARVSVLTPDDLPVGAADDEDEFGYEDVGVVERLSTSIDQLNDLVRGVGTAILNAAQSVKPDEVSATFGIELGLKPGKAVALLADGEAKAAISVTLMWRAAENAETANAAGADPRRNDA